MENTPVQPIADSPASFFDQDFYELSDPDDLDTTCSPCINVCRMNSETGLCEGCARTLDEISAWPAAGDEQKRTGHYA